MRRLQKELILKDLKKKMVFLVGPRQVGKTWLSKEIMKEYKNPIYLNYDFIEDKKKILNTDWLPGIDLIVFDELHKMPKWKNYLKGVYDTKNSNTHILVTGSARLEIFRQAGDSMAGRYFVHHLMPLTLKELENSPYEKTIDRLMERGGFPEPFLSKNKDDVAKWRSFYIDMLIREDVLNFQKIDDYVAMRNVFEILRHKVGSPISYANIANDVGVSGATVKKYIQILEALYIVYTITPYSKKISRSILKEPKLYFYDIGLVIGDEGSVFENLVANELQKYIFSSKDEKGLDLSLKYLRTKEKKEVDFAIVENFGEIKKMIEVKLSEKEISKNLLFFSEKFNLKGIQVVKNIRYGSKINDKLEIREIKDFLLNL